MSSSNVKTHTSSGLNVVALISGGKDSLYSLLHCIRNGHKVVALANLYPAKNHHQHHDDEKAQNDIAEGTDGEEDDIDSFMYQTIGHSVIPLYESALGIPLYRAPITGGAVDTSRIYRHNASDQMAEAGEVEDEEQDETECLIPLLRRIKKEHPEVNAVSAGAILSTYQRTRIENVAARLGLVPLAWLWMYPVLPPPVERKEVSGLSSAVADAGLLEDMAACGCEARIIKVASGGLDEGYLWGDVSSTDGALRRRIVKGMKRFADAEDIRGAVLGEGGEYESLALDGPGFLWKQKIEIEEQQVRTGEGGVGYMRLKGARCVPKTVGESDASTPESVRRPSLLNETFAGVLDRLLLSRAEYESVGSTTEPAEKVNFRYEPFQSRNGGTWQISNITAPEAGPGAAEQMEGIARKMKEILNSSVQDTPYGRRSTEDIVFTTVLLRSMADFALMNNTYVSLFKKPNPPARATVACGDGLPEGAKVMVSFIVDLGPRELRNGLHVQSRSYWAPANIGPYSQAMSIPLQGAERLVYIAGQIPLDPASMEIIDGSLVTEKQSWIEDYSVRAVLSLQHLWRIGAAMQVDWWMGAVAFFTGEDHIEARARVAWSLWEKMHDRQSKDAEEDEDNSTLDAWDIKYGRREYEQTTSGTEMSTLPKFSVVQSDAVVPPFFAVQIEELPRGSDIEWQSLGYRCDGLEMSTEEIEHGLKIVTTTNENLSYTGIEIDKGQSDTDLENYLQQQILAAYAEQPGLSHAVIYTARSLRIDSWPGQIVPCKSVWGQKGRELVAGIILQRSR